MPRNIGEQPDRNIDKEIRILNQGIDDEIKVLSEWDPEKMPEKMVIDNGADRISIDVAGLRWELESLGLSKETLGILLKEIYDCKKDVEKEFNKDGTHLGSTMLEEFVAQEVGRKDPSNYNLETKLELKLISRLVARFCKREEKERLNISWEDLDQDG